MHDFSCKNASDMYFDDMAEATRYYKEMPDGREIMCKAMEDMRNEKEIETRVIDISRLMRTLKMTVEQAMDALEIPKKDRGAYLTRLDLTK